MDLISFKNETIERNRESLKRWRDQKEPRQFDIDGLKIKVLANVFPPKTDSVLLAQSVDIKKGDIVLDTCAGSGIQAVYLAKIKKVGRVYSCDISDYAIENIKLNAEINGVSDKIEVIKCDVFPKLDIKYDVIMANPPYTDYEAKDILERSLWDKGNTVVKTILTKGRDYLKKGGKMYLSWANFADFSFFESLAKDSGWKYKVIAKGSNDPKYNRTVDPRSENRVYELT